MLFVARFAVSSRRFLGGAEMKDMLRGHAGGSGTQRDRQYVCRQVGSPPRPSLLPRRGCSQPEGRRHVSIYR